MRTAEILTALEKARPNGLSLEPMAIRLLRQEVHFEDWQIEEIKTAMFQVESRLWFSSKMILDDNTLRVFQKQIRDWLDAHDCFSVEQLFKKFRDVLRHIATPNDCASFLQHLRYQVVRWKELSFCTSSSLRLRETLETTSKTISEKIDAMGGMLPFQEIEQEMPYLTAEALERIRMQLLPEIHKIEVSDMPCWCTAAVISLPDDFSEKLTSIIDTLVVLEEKVSVGNIEFALNLFYRTSFRKQYDLLDNDTFIKVCMKNYQGENAISFKIRKNCVSAIGDTRQNPARSLIQNFLNEHLDNTLIVKTANRPHFKKASDDIADDTQDLYIVKRPLHKLMVRIHADTQEHFISYPAFRAWCKIQHLSAKTIIDELWADNLLVSLDPLFFSLGRFVTEFKGQTRVFIVKGKKLEREINQDEYQEMDTTKP